METIFSKKRTQKVTVEAGDTGGIIIRTHGTKSGHDRSLFIFDECVSPLIAQIVAILATNRRKEKEKGEQ